MLCTVEVVERFSGIGRKGQPTMLGRWRALPPERHTPDSAKARAQELFKKYGATRIRCKAFEIVLNRDSVAILTR